MNTSHHTGSIVEFLLYTFLWSWLLWLPGILDSHNVNIPEPLLALGMLAVFGPTVSAFIMVAKTTGKSGVKDMLKRGFFFRFQKKWLLPVLLLAPASSALSLFIGSLLTGENVSLPSLTVVPELLIMFFVGGPLAEEFGWRGFALDKFQSFLSPLKAGLLLGVIWGVWHLPLHFISGSVQENIPVWAYILIITVSSVLFTWIYNRTNRSIAAVMLFHWTVNIGNIVFPYWQLGGEKIVEQNLPNLWMPSIGMITGFIVLLVTVVLIYSFGRISPEKE